MEHGDSDLDLALERATARARELVAGGAALLLEFGESPEADGRIRSAAGFRNIDAAREAARPLWGPARRAIPQAGASPSLQQPSAAGDFSLYPLLHDGRSHGMLCVLAPTRVISAQHSALEDVANHVALLLDHARLGLEHEDLLVRASDREAAQARASEEALDLSEALFAQDIELLQKEEKIVMIERLKDDFIEKMSCELRTPLGGIIESIIGVLANENENLSSSAKESLRGALDEGTRFLRTLQNILDLWKIRQGELPIQIEPVNVSELLAESIFSVQATIDSHALAISKQLPENLPPVGTDLGKLGQVLYLVLDNATKFTPSGSVEIRIDLEGSPSAPQLRCEIEDSGVGICTDDQAFVFDEFFQVDGGADRKCAGAGLGLALTRDLVALLGGDVWVRSDAGHGTTLGFQIPVQMDARS